MNILMIVVDDLGWNDVSYHGSEIPTPNIDSLASEGVKLNSFYTHSICTPTRAELMTGRYSFRYGLQRIIWPWNDRGLSLEEKILPQYFKEANFKTYAVGKWNLGHYHKDYVPNSRGFDYYFGSHCGSVDHFDHTYYNVHDLNENRNPFYSKGRHLCDLHTEKICKIIKNQDKIEPFFVYAAFNSPHLPLKPKQEYYDSLIHIKDKNRRRSAALVKHLDDSIGFIISCLKEQGLYEDTLIWFTSDNGGWTWDGCGGNNYPLKGGKVSFYEGGIRVVNFIHGPKFFNPSEYEGLCHITDVLPTLCELCNIEINGPSEIDGVSLVNSIKNNICSDRTLFHELYKINDNLIGCIRHNEWKFMSYNKKEELYNIKNDFCEHDNLVDTNKDVRDLLHGLMDKKTQNDFNQDDPRVAFFWEENNGPPKNFKFPKFWGPKKQQIKILKSDFEFVSKNFEDFDVAEIFGYENIKIIDYNKYES